MLIAPGRRQPLSPQEHTILLALMGRPYCNAELLAEAVWPDPDDMPDSWHDALSVLVCTLRQKLRYFGWIIPTSNRRGWTLESE